MTVLTWQKILLIGIGFYDYEAAIADEFRALGAEVWVENTTPPQLRGALAPLRRRFLDGARPLARHQAAMLERARALGRLDHVVVIKPTLLDDPFLTALREVQPGAQFIAYHWDSMARFPDLVHRQALFDRVLTFDHADAASNPRFILRPNFYRPELGGGTPPAPTIDLCFFGWLHHDRLKQIDEIRRQAHALELTTLFYLSTGSWTRFKLSLAGAAKDVHTRPQPFADYVSKSRAARVLLDLPHPRQTGLTFRAIDSIGAGKKLITTAADIAAYDFYRPENICIVDPVTPRIDLAFFATPNVPLPAALTERYGLRAWALDVLGITAPAGVLAERGMTERSEPEATVLAVLVLYRRDVESAASWSTLRGLLGRTGRFRLGHCLVYDNSPQRDGEVILPNGASLIWAPDNRGTAGAYSAAIDVAAAHGCDWLLFLDQDTELPTDYLDRAALAALTPMVSVLVPRVRHNSDLVSPSVITAAGSVRPTADPASVAGMPTAISSGMLARREAVAAAVPFPDALWLDYVDHWMFLAFSRRGTKFGMIDVDLAHDLSIRTPRLLSRERLASILAAEEVFYRELEWPARVLFPVRRLARAAKFAVSGHLGLAVLTLRRTLQLARAS